MFWLGMKNLKDTILEKLKVDDIIPDAKFPIDKHLKEIVEFLKEQGFKDVNRRGSKDIIFNSEKSKCFTYIKDFSDRGILWFADTTKEAISEKNPMFLIKSIPNTSVFAVYYMISGEMIYKTDNDKEEFLEELNKCFGWQ